MKKILLSLGTLATVAAPIAAVVSCGNDDNKTTKPTAGADANPGNNTPTTDANPGNNTPTTDAGAGNTGTGEQTPQAAISSASLAKIGAGILADGRILNNLLSKDSMDDFVNALINITRTVQKAAHETAVFEDSFVFDHATKTTVDKAAKVVRELLIELVSEIGGGDTIQTILKGAVKESAVANMLKEASFTTGFATFLHEIKLVRLLSNSTIANLLTKDKMIGFISGALPIKEKEAGHAFQPTTMVLDGPAVPKFQQGTSKSLTMTFDLDAAGGLFRRAATTTQPAAATAAPAETIKKFDLVKDLLPLIAPTEERGFFSGRDHTFVQTLLLTFIGSLSTELGAHEEVVGRFTATGPDGDQHISYGNGIIDRVVQALESLVPHGRDANGNIIQDLLAFSIGSTTSWQTKVVADNWASASTPLTSAQYSQRMKAAFRDVTSTKTETELKTALASKTTITAADLGLTDFADLQRDTTSVAYTIEDYSSRNGDILVHYTLTGAHVAANTTGTFYVTPKSSAYQLATNGIINAKAINTNNGTTYANSSFELRSRIDDSILATKAANETNMVFTTDTLPLIDGVILAGNAISTITVPQLSHAMDMKKIFGLAQMALGKVPSAATVIPASYFSAIEALAARFQATGIKIAERSDITGLYTQWELPAQALSDAETVAKYKMIEQQFALLLAGAPEYFAALPKAMRDKLMSDTMFPAGPAKAGEPVKYMPTASWINAETHTREQFTNYANQMKAHGTTVMVNGAEKSIGEAMQTVLDLVKSIDATQWVNGVTQPAPFVNPAIAFSDADSTKLHEAIHTLIEATNAGSLLLPRLISAQFSDDDN